MRVLELFSGANESFSTVANEMYNMEVITLDSLRKYEPDIVADILTWDYKKAREELGYFDIIWASPPCRFYSIARRVKGTPEEIAYSNKLVRRAVEIIEYFKPRYWIIENPQTGRLKDQCILDGFNYVDVDQCNYGRNSRKRTRLWLNFDVPIALMCTKWSRCKAFVGTKHIQKVDSGSFKSKCIIVRGLCEHLLFYIIRDYITDPPVAQHSTDDHS